MVHGGAEISAAPVRLVAGGRQRQDEALQQVQTSPNQFGDMRVSIQATTVDLQLFSMLRKECEVAELGTSPLPIIAHSDPSGEMKHWYQRTKVASMLPLAKSISLISSGTFFPRYSM